MRCEPADMRCDFANMRCHCADMRCTSAFRRCGNALVTAQLGVQRCRVCGAPVRACVAQVHAGGALLPGSRADSTAQRTAGAGLRTIVPCRRRTAAGSAYSHVTRAYQPIGLAVQRCRVRVAIERVCVTNLPGRRRSGASPRTTGAGRGSNAARRADVRCECASGRCGSPSRRCGFADGRCHLPTPSCRHRGAYLHGRRPCRTDLR